MHIDELDFSNKDWFCVLLLRPKLLCQSECDYLDTTWESFFPGEPETIPTHVKYASQLANYYERFGQHMPDEIRKSLLLDIKARILKSELVDHDV